MSESIILKKNTTGKKVSKSKEANVLAKTEAKTKAKDVSKDVVDDFSYKDSMSFLDEGGFYRLRMEVILKEVQRLLTLTGASFVYFDFIGDDRIELSNASVGYSSFYEIKYKELNLNKCCINQFNFNLSSFVDGKIKEVDGHDSKEEHSYREEICKELQKSRDNLKEIGNLIKFLNEEAYLLMDCVTDAEDTILVTKDEILHDLKYPERRRLPETWFLPV